MELKTLNILFLAFFIFGVNSTALPRHSSQVNVKSVESFYDDSSAKESQNKLPEPTDDEFKIPGINIPGRVSCQFEEPTEDPVCQEHCFPKGYKYGLCVSRICSCI